MLPQKNRLPMREGMHSGFQTKTPLFVLKGTKTALPVSRFAFIVSKRIDKRATVRNTLKRLYRACIQDALSSIRPGYDILFIATKSMVKDQKQILCAQIKEQLKKQQVLSSL